MHGPVTATLARVGWDAPVTPGTVASWGALSAGLACTIMGYGVFWVAGVVGTVFSRGLGAFGGLVHCTAGILGREGMERGSKVYQGYPFVGKKCGRGPLPGWLA